jgi:glycosyltransferase involved in cell wall biosynthesis
VTLLSAVVDAAAGTLVDQSPTLQIVDVIIVVKNRVDTLGDALSSVGPACSPDGRSSSDLRCEPRILVIDGDSMDGSDRVAATWPGARLEAQSGLGLGDARNQGLASSDAEFVAFLDADDVWTPGSLLARVRHLLENPAADAVIGGFEVFSLSGPLPSRFASQVDEQISGLTPGALVCRRSVFDRVGYFSTTLSIGTDTDWFSRAIDSGIRIDQLDDVVLRKGIGETNLSHATAQYRAELLRIVRDHIHRSRRD